MRGTDSRFPFFVCADWAFLKDQNLEGTLVRVSRKPVFVPEHLGQKISGLLLILETLKYFCLQNPVDLAG